MTEQDIRHARESVATPEFEAMLGHPPGAGRALEPAGVAHLVLRGVKLHLLTLADEVERLQGRIAEMEALDVGQRGVIHDLREANAALNDVNMRGHQKQHAMQKRIRELEEICEAVPQTARGELI